MNGVEERTGCQATSFKTGRCKWKYFYFTDVRRARGAEPIKKGWGKKRSVSARGGLNVTFLKDFIVLIGPVIVIFFNCLLTNASG